MSSSLPIALLPWAPIPPPDINIIPSRLWKVLPWLDGVAAVLNGSSAVVLPEPESGNRGGVDSIIVRSV